jgi:glutaryl-CoA dehydrogenase
MSVTPAIVGKAPDTGGVRPVPASLDLEAEHLFTAEELGWRERVRAFCRRRIAPVADADFEDRHFRYELVRDLGELGVLGMHLQGYGCAGAGAVSYGVACMELEAGDSAWCTFVSVQGSLVMSAIAKWGSAEQKEQWLSAMAAGRAIGCFGLTEPGRRSDPAAMRSFARRDGADWVINGAKRTDPGPDQRGQAQQRPGGTGDRQDRTHYPRRRRSHQRLPRDAAHGQPGVRPYL